MSVVSSENGISASCAFSGYSDKKEYVVQLYLYRVGEGNSLTTISYEELTPAGEGLGTGNTAWKHVDTGIYKAVAAIKRYDGGNLAETEFADSELYDVIRSGNSYTVKLHLDTVEDERGEASSRRKKAGRESMQGNNQEDETGFVCEHHIVFEIIKEAEAKQDALLAEQCEKCGAVFSCSYVPNSAYAVFLREAASAIENTEGEEVVIVTDRWMSFNREVLDAIEAKPGVTVIIHYQYEGNPRRMTIPAGTKAGSLADENGFCGFLYLEQLFAEREKA